MGHSGQPEKSNCPCCCLDGPRQENDPRRLVRQRNTIVNDMIINIFRYTNRYKQTRFRQNVEMRHRQMNSPSVNRGVGAPICPTEF